MNHVLRGHLEDGHRVSRRGLSFQGQKGYHIKLCDKDVAELSGEYSGAVCCKTLVLFGNALELFRKCCDVL